MLRDHTFTPTAVAPQSFACMLFLASALRFTTEYRRSGGAEDALLASLAFLFALAEGMFIYSTLWDARWWFWHVIRLTAYLLVLGSMVHGYRRMVVDLEASLAQTTRAEEAARRSEQQLREALDRRERMAQDLHDGIIQSVFAMGLSLERCQGLVTKNPPEAVDLLGRARASLKSIIRDLRAYITGLEPEMTEGAHLPTVLTSLARTMEHADNFRCRVDIDPCRRREDDGGTGHPHRLHRPRSHKQQPPACRGTQRVYFITVAWRWRAPHDRGRWAGVQYRHGRGTW